MGLWSISSVRCSEREDAGLAELEITIALEGGAEAIDGAFFLEGEGPSLGGERFFRKRKGRARGRFWRGRERRERRPRLGILPRKAEEEGVFVFKPEVALRHANTEIRELSFGGANFFP